MNKANQQQLLQATNIGLISIRQSEINYYTNIYLSLGTQSALLGGFSYTTFTQNKNGNAFSEETYKTIDDLYWITSALTIAASVHVIINCMMLQVLGPGLALNGPVGSMARATNGMRLELRQIVVAFILEVLFFAISNLLSFWVVMDFQSALAGSILTLAAVYYWAYYCERIYLRFYWKKEEEGWNAAEGADDVGGSFSEPGASFRVKREFVEAGSDGKQKKKLKSAVPKWLRKFTKMNKEKARRLDRAITLSVDVINEQQQHQNLQRLQNEANLLHKAADNSTEDDVLPATMKGIMVEGFLSRLINTRKSQKEKWERNYAILNTKGYIYYYKSRNEFRNDPNDRINERPIIVSDFDVSFLNTLSAVGSVDCSLEEYTSAMISNKSTLFRRASASEVVVFELTLTAKDDDGTVSRTNTYDGSTVSDTDVASKRKDNTRRKWIFRCDTESEFKMWINAMKNISPESFPDLTQQHDFFSVKDF